MKIKTLLETLYFNFKTRKIRKNLEQIQEEFMYKEIANTLYNYYEDIEKAEDKITLYNEIWSKVEYSMRENIKNKKDLVRYYRSLRRFKSYQATLKLQESEVQ